jgi:hypothetical protein
MKKLTLLMSIIISLSLMGSTPLPVKRSTQTKAVVRTSLLTYSYFEHGGYYLGVCSLPNMAPFVEDSDGNYLGAIDCPSGTSVVNVVEGQQIRFRIRIYYQNMIQLIYSPYHTVTAADFTNGLCFLVASI